VQTQNWSNTMKHGLLVTTTGKASLYRKESFNGRTTAQIEWIVKVGDQVIRYCNTKKEAITWLALYKD
jgi:hypothetical protein